MAAGGSPPDSVGAFVGMLLMGLVFAIPGLILATNFRGLADRHMSLSLRSAGFLRRVPPWKWFAPIDPAHPPRWLRYQYRSIGIVFALAGAGMFVGGIAGLVKHM